ncbi:hypothetical protein E0K89_018805 [Aquicoccus sp. SCR17]|nr:hypothetical protein [Carideicomes alvinocaridis]
MSIRRFNLVLAFLACFVAIEAGALVVCIGIMILDSGLLAAPAGLSLWVIAQPIALLIALGSMPVGALLRMILGLTFKAPRPVALSAGAAVGLGSSIFLALSTKDGLAALISISSIGLFAGVIGGWLWWRVEKPFLDRQDL